jgi:propanol-preferring alcohol dehydrogenase
VVRPLAGTIRGATGIRLSDDQSNPQPIEERVMKAAIVTSFTEPLKIEDCLIPTARPGQVLVRIEASGLCHTDIHAAHGDWPVKPSLPFIPGHEGVGIIETVGSGVDRRRIGDRVAIPWLGYACGRCDHCVQGWETLCEEQQNTGYSVDGGFAEYAVADADFVVPVPQGIDPVDAAPLTCAGVTTYKAVKVAEIKPTERVAVFGIGGLGHLAVQYARIVGGTVIAVDVDEEKLRLATELGADHVVNASEVDPVEAITELGGADVAIVLAVLPEVFEQAFASLRRGGRLVCVGLPPESAGPMKLPIFPTVLKGISVIGSIVGTRQDLAEVFALHSQGRTVVISESRKLDDVNTAIEDVLQGRAAARLVFEF